MGSRGRPPTPAACTMPPPPQRARSATALLRTSGEAPWLLLVRSASPRCVGWAILDSRICGNPEQLVLVAPRIELASGRLGERRSVCRSGTLTRMTRPPLSGFVPSPSASVSLVVALRFSISRPRMRAPSASGGRRSLRSGLRRLRCRTARGGRTVVSFIREGKDCGIVMVTRSTARVPNARSVWRRPRSGSPGSTRSRSAACRTGAARWCAGVPSRDASGNVLAVFAAARDVTAQKQASQYARSLIEASLDPLVTISVEGKITDVNEATVQATGLGSRDADRQGLLRVLHRAGEGPGGYRQVFAQGQVHGLPADLAPRVRDVHGRAVQRQRVSRQRGRSGRCVRRGTRHHRAQAGRRGAAGGAHRTRAA